MEDAQKNTTGLSIGVAGLGKMGSAIAARLAETGMTVRGWTRSGIEPERARVLAIEAQPDLAALVGGADLVILSLSDDAAVNMVLSDIVVCDLSGKLIVDTSTVSPRTLKARIGEIEAAGGAAIDAPISGWPSMVASGRAGFYVGGGKPHVDRFLPVAAVLADRFHHVGDIGAGAAMKIVNNMMLTGYWQCLKEALQVGGKAGLDAETMLEILAASPAANGSLKAKAPVILGQSDSVSFTVDGIVKDLSLFAATAVGLGVDAPAIAAALGSFEGHRARGHGDEDFATMLRSACNGVDPEAADHVL